MNAVLQSFGCIMLASLTALAATAGAEPTRVGVVTAVRGAATLTRLSLPAGTPLRFKDDIYVADRITTGDQAYARILLGGKAVVTVREHSTLTIKEVPGSATIDVSHGKVALAVIKERMKPGEQIELRTPNAVAGIRGTVVITEVAPTAAGVLSTISVLQGLIEVFPLDPTTGQPVGVGVPVAANQSVQVTGFAAPRAVQPITAATRKRLSDEFSLSLEQPRGGAPGLVKSQMQQAAAATDQLLSSKESGDEHTPGAAVGGLGQDVLGPVRVLDAITTDAKTVSGGSVLAPVTSGVSSATSGAGGLLGGTTSALGGAVTGATGALGGALTGTTSALGGALGGPLGGTVTSAGGALGGTTSAAGSTLGGATQSAGGLLGGVTSGVGGLLK